MPERGESQQPHTGDEDQARRTVEDTEGFEDAGRKQKREEERRKEEEAVRQFIELYRESRSAARWGKFQERVFAADGPGGRYEADKVLQGSTLAEIADRTVGELREDRTFPDSREIGIQYHPREDSFYPWHDPEKDQGKIYFIEQGRNFKGKQWFAYLKRHSRKHPTQIPQYIGSPINTYGELSLYALSLEFSDKSPEKMKEEMDLIHLGRPFAYQENERRKDWWKGQNRPKKNIY
ncbi:MAG: hypothetical protein HYV42_00835 [Candidatus Magasanikbacteria bacterium]|nr:hypothetical protein [Candidatus Magasanikbacteria bacterium]